MTDQVLKGESSRAEEIVQILRSRIINGEYAIGEKLVENKIAKELKAYGFKYMGTVTVYAHLQACGVVNDHGDACPCYHAINAQYPTVRKRRYLEKP